MHLGSALFFGFTVLIFVTKLGIALSTQTFLAISGCQTFQFHLNLVNLFYRLAKLKNPIVNNFLNIMMGSGFSISYFL